MVVSERDKSVLRELVKQTMEIAAQDIQDKRREMWADFNSLKTKSVPIYILDPQGVWREVFSQDDLQCEHPLLRTYENWLRLQLYHASFGDDFVTEPWLTVYPAYKNESPNWATWGVSLDYNRVQATMAYHMPEPPVKSQEDLEKLIRPFPLIDETATQEKIALLQDAVGDLIPVLPDYMPIYSIGLVSGLSFTLGYLLEPEQMLYQLYDRPEMVHELCKLISDTYHQIYDEAEKQGWFTNINQTFLGNAQIQSMPYSREIPSPSQEAQAVPMKQHWIYDASQEFESVGPEMFNEFLIEYQRPLYEKFAFTAYGCCENLTHKIKYLKQIKNLRRVAVTPWADLPSCAEQLSDKYIISYRPPPAEMVGNGWDPERVSTIIRQAKEIFSKANCRWEINLKDFITVESDKERLKNWVQTVRSVLEE